MNFNLYSSVALITILSAFSSSLLTPSFAMEDDKDTSRAAVSSLQMADFVLNNDETGDGSPSIRSSEAPKQEEASWSYLDYLPGSGYIRGSSSTPSSQPKTSTKVQPTAADQEKAKTLITQIVTPSLAYLREQQVSLKKQLGSDETLAMIRNLYRQLEEGTVDQGMDFYTPLRNVSLALMTSNEESSSSIEAVAPSQMEALLSHPFVAPIYRAYMEEMAEKIEILVRNTLVLGMEEGGKSLAQQLGITRKVASILLDAAGKQVANKGARLIAVAVAPQLALPLELYNLLKLGFVSNFSLMLASNLDGLVERLLNGQADQMVDQVGKALALFLPTADGAQGFLGTLKTYIETNYEEAFFTKVQALIQSQSRGWIGWIASNLSALVTSYMEIEKDSPHSALFQYFGQLTASYGSDLADAKIAEQVAEVRSNLPAEVREMLDDLHSMQSDIGEICDDLSGIIELMKTLKIKEAGLDFLRKSIRQSLLALKEDLQVALGGNYGQNLLLFQTKDGEARQDIITAATAAGRAESALTSVLWQNIRAGGSALIPDSTSRFGAEVSRYTDSYVGSLAGRLVAQEASVNLEGVIAPMILSALPQPQQSQELSLLDMRSRVNNLASFASPSIGQFLANYSVELMGNQIGPVAGYTIPQLSNRLLPQANSHSWIYWGYQGYGRFMGWYAHTANAVDYVVNFGFFPNFMPAYPHP